MILYVLRGRDLGWDDICSIGGSLGACAFASEFDSVEEMQSSDQYFIQKIELSQLPEGLSFEEAKEKFWRPQ